MLLLELFGSVEEEMLDVLGADINLTILDLTSGSIFLYAERDWLPISW